MFVKMQNWIVSDIKHKDAVRGLKKLGFTKSTSKATSHDQWEKVSPGKPRAKVTLDKHISPYCGDVLSSIINQSKVSKHAFYSACFGWDKKKERKEKKKAAKSKQGGGSVEKVAYQEKTQD